MKYLLVLLVLAGCQTTNRYVADNAEATRLYCQLTREEQYSYDPDHPELSDTLEKVQETILDNEVRRRICGTT